MEKIIGMDKLMKQLEEIANLDKAQALLAGGQVILEEMQALTPVDKGDLLESEGMDVTDDELVIYAGTDHALPVEFGTIHMEAQPYMRPAIDNKSQEALKRMAENIETQIGKIAHG